MAFLAAPLKLPIISRFQKNTVSQKIIVCLLKFFFAIFLNFLKPWSMAHHHIKMSHQFAKSSALEAIHCLRISKKNWQWFRCKKAWSHSRQQNWSTLLHCYRLIFFFFAVSTIKKFCWCHWHRFCLYNTSVVSSSFFVQCYWIINEIGLGDPPHYFYGSVDLQKAGTMGHNRIRDLMYANNLDILDVVSIFVVWMNGGTLYTPECFHPNW